MLGTIEEVQEQIPVIVDDVFLSMLGVPVTPTLVCLLATRRW